MSQDEAKRDQAPDKPAMDPTSAFAAPEDADIAEQVSDDVGGVQGTSPDEDDAARGASAVKPGSPDAAPAPDAGEIEWAGQVVKKPPTPGA